MNREKFLPIGTVVILKGAKKKLMITGYLPVDTSSKVPVAYDYSACLYPEGVLTPTETFLINHNEIEEIFYLGYESEEYNEFDNKLKTELEKLKKEKAKDVSFQNEKNVEKKETEGLNNNIFDNLRE